MLNQRTEELLNQEDNNATKILMKKAKGLVKKEYKRSSTKIKRPPSKIQEDFHLAKERYSKRIRLIEGRLSQLRSNKALPMKSQRIINNAFEKAFYDSFTSVKQKILKRKESELSNTLKISKSLPIISQKQYTEPNIINFKDFTETDKM